jgi:uncharacterized protein YihD (DUF1040 family)
MRDPKRINHITDALNHLWHMAPEQRLIQLLHNVTYRPDRTIYEVDDDELLECIENAIEQLQEAGCVRGVVK